MRALLLIGMLLCASCAPLASFRLSQDVELEVYSMTADEDSFKVRVQFVENTDYRDIIQEGRLTRGDNFVEKFIADPRTGYDTHFADGVEQSGVQRVCTVYVGATENTLDAGGGFAMLPQNQDGSLVTTTGLEFNEKYRACRPVLTGRVVARSAISGDWSIIWENGSVTVVTPDGQIKWLGGKVTVTRP